MAVSKIQAKRWMTPADIGVTVTKAAFTSYAVARFLDGRCVLSFITNSSHSAIAPDTAFATFAGFHSSQLAYSVAVAASGGKAYPVDVPNGGNVLRLSGGDSIPQNAVVQGEITFLYEYD